LNQLFHFDVTGSNISTFKSDFAKRYTKTVAELTERIAQGSLVHADETKARMIAKSGFVWVLASLEDVVFLYSDTREGESDAGSMQRAIHLRGNGLILTRF
jgi:Transposase IS66 family